MCIRDRPMAYGLWSEARDWPYAIGIGGHLCSSVDSDDPTAETDPRGSRAGRRPGAGGRVGRAARRARPLGRPSVVSTAVRAAVARVRRARRDGEAVSYTHLTLPTSDL